jgi:O-glycosyl hydrolase
MLIQYLRFSRNEYNSDMRSASSHLALCLTAFVCLFLSSLAAPSQTIATPAQSVAPAQPIAIDAASPGRIFDGVGAISGGGGNARLLIDYPEPQRSQILDYLFRPNYGASIQIFKVEIGADMDSTDGAESSHMHTAADQNYSRGYEWWLMEQARARNPNIKFVALPWGAPAWVGNGNYWSQDMIDYIIKWLKHAQSDHHLTIGYLGGRNEKSYNIQWYKDLRASLRANGLGSIKVMASDDWVPKRLWTVATDMKNDPALNDAIDIVGVHGPWWSGYTTPDALALGKPIWDSEGHFDEHPGTPEMARNINRNYIAGRATATVFWPIISAIYDNLPYDNIGLVFSNQPWSGHYVVTPSVWAMAHTTQFTEPGWQYLDSASGFFSADATGAHGSYVALRSPNRKNFSLIIETVQSKSAETTHFSIAGFPQRKLHLWTTDLSSSDSAQWFVKQPDVRVSKGKFSLALQPGRMYTVTTTTGQAKGNAVPPAAAPFNLPYADNFKSYPPGRLAKYFSDMYGAFETAPCDGGRSGICLSQLVPLAPIAWKGSDNRPFTILGNLDWTDYTVSTDVLFEQPGSADLIGRLTGMSGSDIPNSYVLRVADTGAWSLRRTSTTQDKRTRQGDTVLAAGSVSPLGVKQWHRLSLSFNGSQITPQIDGNPVTIYGKPINAVTDATYAKGMVGLGTLNYALVQFDNFQITPIKDTASTAQK